MWQKARHVVAALSLALLATAQGCAEERDPINQVQIGAMPKSFFVGSKLEDASDDPEFYFRTTVVDVAAGAGAESLFTSTDSQPTTRIRWEITETKLLARLAYELIDDTDGAGKTTTSDPTTASKSKAPAKTTTNGQIVASFAIEKQFDIRRSYNESTGEETNMIVENDHDRPWNQRDYIRVDWSANLVTEAYDLDAASQMGLWGGVKWEPIAYQVNDPKNPDAPVVDVHDGYFDITTKAYAAPQMVHDEEYGDYPACWLAGNFPRISCNPSEVKMRHSFRRVVDTDYEPLDFDGTRMDMFGYFTSDRYGYDRKHGIVDDKWHRFAARWNVYEKSHAEPAVVCATTETTPAGTDPHRDDDHDGTEDECAGVGRGSTCDEFNQLCTIPLRDRKMRTTVWHVNPEFPEDLFGSAHAVVKTWSDAVRVGILAGRLAECRRTGESDCEGSLGWPARWSDDFVPPVGKDAPNEVAAVFILCHNPVDRSKGDDELCGKDGTTARLGDLRYNFFNYVVSPQAAAPWGIMVDAEDPLTGEKVSGSVNMFGATLDRAAGTLVDLVSLLNGVTPPTSFIQGKDVSDWVSGNRPNGKYARPSPMTSTELSGRLSAFDPKVMTPLMTGTKTSRNAPAKLRHEQRMKALANSGKLGLGNGAIAQRASALRGTDVEAKMIAPEVAQLAGFDPTAAVTKSTIDRATPFASSAPVFRREMARRSARGRARHHACRREAPDADYLISLARRAQSLFGTVDAKNAAAVAEQREKIYQWAREQYALGVYSHEFGHSVGLRHNFAGTFDSLNYDENYWQLRTKNGTVTKACTAGTTDGSNCIGPRYVDPLTEEETNGGINGFATSSVMDYPGDQSLDMYLIGKYDRAAVRFGYGGVVDVWAAPGVSVTGSGDGKATAYELTAFASSPGLFGVYDLPVPDSTDSKHIHYSQYASEFGLVNDCKSDAEAPLGTACKGAELDVVDYRDMKDFAAIPDYAEFASTKRAVDSKGRVRRGYMFSSDEYADSGNVPSFSFDTGADPYEQVRFLESAYENRYILDDFRRNRTQFNSWDVVSRTQSRYLDPVQLISKTFAFAMVLDVDDPSNPPADLLGDGQYGPLATAASVGFDLFTRILTRPEPGEYCSPENEDCYVTQPPGLLNWIYSADPYPVPSQTTYSFGLGLGPGRYVHNDFDYDKGYWWSDYQKQVGSFYDKTWAVYYLSEAYDSFISNSKEDFIDGRYKNVNFATIYPEQTRRLFGALLTGDLETFAPYADTETNGAASADLVYPDWHLAAGVGTRPANAKIVDPSFGWNEQLYAMVWGTMFFPTSWSNAFINDARITALATEQISWPAAETITFVDPETSLVYRAHKTGTEMLFDMEKQKGIGARMLEWANNLVTLAYVCELDKDGWPVPNADGTPKLILKDGKPQPNPDYPGGIGTLRAYVANLDVMRQLVGTFVRPLGESLPSP